MKTKTTNHTPGPWKLDNFGAILANDFEGDGKPGISRIVCDVRDSEKWGMGHEKAIANGRLIAAAPDAHAILSMLADFIANGAETVNLSMLAGDDEAGRDVPRTLRSEILAYMAKAEVR